MKLVVAGGAGFLGRALVEAMAPVASEIVVLSRSPHLVSGARVCAWDGKSIGDWVNELDGAHAVVNYAGSPIFSWWTRANRRQIVNSRLTATRVIGAAIAACRNPPRVWVNASATGYYGDCGAEPVDESSPPGAGFLAGVCSAWEAAARESTSPGTLVTLLRTGVVLDPGHPPLSLLLLLTKLFIGGRLGNGRAFLPWIGVHDQANLVRRCIEHEIGGPVNAVAPEAITNATLMKTLRARLGRPAAPPVPSAPLRFAGRFGFPAEAVFFSTRAAPSVAAHSGFEWQTPHLGDLLRDIR